MWFIHIKCINNACLNEQINVMKLKTEMFGYAVVNRTARQNIFTLGSKLDAAQQSELTKTVVTTQKRIKKQGFHEANSILIQ